MLAMLSVWALLVNLLLHCAQGSRMPPAAGVTDVVTHAMDSTHMAEISNSYTERAPAPELPPCDDLSLHQQMGIDCQIPSDPPATSISNPVMKVKWLECFKCLEVLGICFTCIVSETCSSMKCLEAIHHCVACFGHIPDKPAAMADHDKSALYNLDTSQVLQTAEIKSRSIRVWQNGHSVANLSLVSDWFEVSVAGDASNATTVDQSSNLSQNALNNGGMVPWCLKDDSGSNLGWFYCYDPPVTLLPPCSSRFRQRPALDCWPRYALLP